MARNYLQIGDMYKHLKNPQKYLSENKVITARSGWEIQFIMKFLDRRSDVVNWSSEDFFINYFYPVDGKVHRYFPDILMSVRTKEGKIVEHLIEIKPEAERFPPKVPKRQNKAYKERVNTFIKNQVKWKAAEAWCESERKKGRVIFFSVLTEKDFPFT